MRPEEKVEIQLWQWLQVEQKNIKVYFNRKNKLNCKVFTTKGINMKPDLIICFFDTFKGKQYIAIEVKDGGTNRNIFDAYKIFSTYYKNFVQGKTKYFIDNEEVKINHFVVGTQFSLYGKIFFDDNIIVDNIDKGQNDVWRKMSAKNKTLPRCEYEKTRNYLRSLWSMFREFRNKNTQEVKPSLGILESDILLNFHPTELKVQSGMKGKPIISIMQWKDWLKKPQWQQSIIKLYSDNEDDKQTGH